MSDIRRRALAEVSRKPETLKVGLEIAVREDTVGNATDQCAFESEPANDDSPDGLLLRNATADRTRVSFVVAPPEAENVAEFIEPETHLADLNRW